MHFNEDFHKYGKIEKAGILKYVSKTTILAIRPLQLNGLYKSHGGQWIGIAVPSQLRKATQP